MSFCAHCFIADFAGSVTVGPRRLRPDLLALDPGRCHDIEVVDTTDAPTTVAIAGRNAQGTALGRAVISRAVTGVLSMSDDRAGGALFV
jgi:hypothetical protein